MTTLILSDIHANLPALERVLEVETEWERLIVLGDAVDCGPQPSAVLDELSDHIGHFVLGNHDRTVLDARTYSDSVPRERWQYWSREQLSTNQIRFLESWPNSRQVECETVTARLHHGKFPLPPGFDNDCWEERLRQQTSTDILTALSERYPEPYVFHGHSHYPYIRDVNGTTFVNPGSVGLQRPGERQDVARYAVLDAGTIELRSVTYAIERVCKAMERVPLPDAFIEVWNECFLTGNGPRPH